MKDSVGRASVRGIGLQHNSAATHGAQGRRARERGREPGKIRVGPVAMRRLAWPAARLLHGAPARFG